MTNTKTIDQKQLVNDIGALSENGFINCCHYMLSKEYGDRLVCSKSASNVWYSEKKLTWESGLIYETGLAKQFYIINYLPYELFSNPSQIPFDNPTLRGKLISLKKEFNDDPGLLWHAEGTHYYGADTFLDFCVFINAIYNDQDEIKQIAFEQIRKMLNDLGISDWRDQFFDRLHLGNPHSFVKANPFVVSEAVKYAKSLEAALSIEYSKDGYEVNILQDGKYITAGVGRASRNIFYPSMVERSPEDVCKEFEKLLNSEPSERVLREFLTDNFKLLFGNKYDTIIPEVALRFPELDISGKNRRIDLMLHDSVINDWEIIELKKHIHLTRQYRDGPVFAADVQGALAQVRNYYNILQQKEVRDYFLREGIEYYKPTMKLIIGGKKNVTHAQWRELVSSVQDIKILTYDSLLQEMKARYQIGYTSQ